MTSSDIDALIETFQLSKREVLRAARRALNRAMTSIKHQIKRQGATDLRIKGPLLAQRMRHYRSHKLWRTTLLMFTEDMPIIILSKPKVTDGSGGGVSVGQHYVPHGFLVRNVKRAGKGKTRDFIFTRAGPKRYPLREARKPIDTYMQGKFSTMKNRAESIFLSAMEREIKLLGGAFKS